jgi:hypothetical protein
VTEIIGTGKVDLGFKAMIHTLAVRLEETPLLSHLLTPEAGQSP